MSGESGSGRLPSLNSSAGKPALKFKPKAIVRRTREEREASAAKIKAEEAPKAAHDKRKDGRKTTGSNNQQRRMNKFLNNTHVISSGPLAAGNFVSEKGNDMRRGFIKSEGGMSSLIQSGLRNLGSGNDISDDDQEIEEKAKEDGAKSKSKFNMGREYVVHEVGDDDDEVESDHSGELDEEALQAKRVEELFPVRPLRIRHEDLEVVEKRVQEALSDVTSREVTPAVRVKREGDESVTNLQDILTENETTLKNKLKSLNIQNQFQSLDENETLLEMKSLAADQLSIAKKINRLNDKPNRFILFQLPSQLPHFKDVTPKASEDEPMPDAAEEPNAKEDHPENATSKKDAKHTKSESVHVPQDSLIGNIGSIRVHKSGRISVKIGNVVMDVSRGAETTFLQDVVALNNAGETPSIEALGRVDGRVVVTPRF